MGKIKQRLIKRTTRTLLTSDLPLSEDFEQNKKVLGRDMPSKKVRNQIAGYISHLKKMERVEQEKLQESLKAVKK
jgi:small subunit ribosomal protein S17e